MKPKFNTLLHSLVNPAPGFSAEWPMLTFDPHFVAVSETTTEAGIRTTLGLRDGLMCHLHPLLVLVAAHDVAREAYVKDEIYDLTSYQPSAFSNTESGSMECEISPGETGSSVWPFPAPSSPLSNRLLVRRAGSTTISYQWGDAGPLVFLDAVFAAGDHVVNVRDKEGRTSVALTLGGSDVWEVGGDPVVFLSYPPNYPAADILEKCLRVEGFYDLLETSGLTGLFSATVSPQVKLAAVAGALALSTAARF